MNVVLLFGGDGAEYEISLRSAASLLPSLAARNTVYPIGINREGGWYLTSPEPRVIAEDTWQSGAVPVLLDPAGHSLLADGAPLPVDVVFPLLHGGLGEGGGMASLLTLLGIPYVGCGPRAGMLGMDKVLAKQVAERAGIRVARYRAVRADEPLDASLYGELAATVGYPMFVKPSGLGSSIGASCVPDSSALATALAEAHRYDRVALCEELIRGSEVEVALLADGDLLRGELVGEVDPGAVFYDYDTKYRTSSSRIFIPARLPSALLTEVREQAKRIFRLFGCRSLARVDFFVRGEEVIFNEINTMPGFTDISMFPRLMQAAGFTPVALAEALLADAVGKA